MVTTSHSAMAAALLESDRLYFELGARVDRIDAAALAWMPDLPGAPGACVVQRVCDVDFRGEPARWVADLTERLSAMGASVARVYLDTPFFSLEVALAAAGYRRRVEIGYLAADGLPANRGDVTLRQVVTDADWEAKHELHDDLVETSDGHRLAGHDWVELERTKCASGAMQAYLVECDGTVGGAIAGLHVDGLLRAKNLLVRPELRGQGMGAAAMHLISAEAERRGSAATGIFGVEGRAGNALYRRLGMTPVVEQFEWAKPLASAAGSGTRASAAGSGTRASAAGSGTRASAAGSGTRASAAGSGTRASAAGSGTRASAAGSGDQ